MAESLISVNGHIEATHSNLLSRDRGLHYGDGLFETIAIIKPKHFGASPLLPYHIKRLNLGLERLRFSDFNSDQLIQDVAHFVEQVEQRHSAPWVLKLIITRGLNQRSYVPEKGAVPTILMFQNEFPTYPARFYTEGVHLEWSQVVLPVDPLLAGMKHLNRLPQVLASADLNTFSDCQELLLCNANGHVIEGTKSNLFWVDANNQIKTPSLKESGVLGVMRAWVIEKLREQQLAVVEVNSTPDEVQAAKEIFLCNSIIGIWPVKGLANRCYKVGSISKFLQQTRQKEFHLVSKT